MKSKIISFVVGIITGLIGGWLSIQCYSMTGTFPNSGIEALANLVTIPIVFVLFLVAIALLISSITLFIKCLFSKYVVIKIFSVILLIVSLGFIGFNIYAFMSILA